jgi:two-component system NtrC family sensor kinase
MLKESRRMKRIIDNLLQFSRQGDAVSAVVNLDDALREVLAFYQYCARTRNFETVVEIQPGIKPISFDEDQIKQVLLNLLGNAADAIQHVEENRRITIRAFERDTVAVLEIEDTGTGFADVSRAFDPFYTTKPVGKGTGLGLSICYGIVKKHRGEIYAENLPEGARVTLKLPFAERIEVPGSIANSGLPICV